MWLRATRETQLIHYEPDDLASSWCVDVMAAADLTAPASGPEAYPVGRILADELRRFEIAEWGEDIWTVADADSSGLEAAWAAVLDEDGAFRENEFDGPADPVIYLYRFKLHEDFSAWRLAVLDACCRAFGEGALVLAQHHTTWLSEAEFELLGFRLLPTAVFSAPGFPNIDRETRFMARDNVLKTRFQLSDYPEVAPPATTEHAEWLEQQGGGGI